MADPFESTLYRRNFLKDVIARIDFLSPLAGVDQALPRQLSEAATRRFPIPEPKDAVRGSVEFNAQSGEVKADRQRGKQWNFHGTDRKKILTIDATSALVHYKHYEKYERVREDFLAIAERIGSVFSGVQLQRVGLRYINVLDIPESNPLDWAAYVKPSLLSARRRGPASARSS